jgi:hypothetical protein
MRYWMVEGVSDVVYSGCEVTFEQVTATGAPIQEITEAEYKRHKLLQVQFCKEWEMDLERNGAEWDNEEFDIYFAQEGLKTCVVATPNNELNGWKRTWEYSAEYGLGQVSRNY